MGKHPVEGKQSKSSNKTVICYAYESDLEQMYAFYCARYKDIKYDDFMKLGFEEFSMKLASIPKSEPLYEIIKSIVDVVFNKIMRRDINPVVIDVETVLERPVSQTILANSISLTPGTLSVDLDSENQIIKVAAISPRSKEDIIPFEKYIKKMLE